MERGRRVDAGDGGGRVTERGAGPQPRSVDPETERPVTFAGRAATVIPPGEEAVSDPVPVAASGPLAVTIAVPALPPVISEHPVALQTSWLAPRGVPPELGAPMTSWLLLSGVDVLAPRPVHAIVAVGDSITDGVGTTPDADARWTDALAARLAATGGDATMAVLNAGISRNELLADGDGGPPPQARFADDVAAALGATDVVLNIGTNDIAAGRDAAAIEAGLARFADAARAAGKRVFLTTITPSTAGTHGTPRAIATRDAVNAWMRAHGREHAAGVVDFAAAVADPAHPERLAPAADAGDGLHLSAAGYRALAAAVPVAALSGSPCLADDPRPLAPADARSRPAVPSRCPERGARAAAPSAARDDAAPRGTSRALPMIEPRWVQLDASGRKVEHERRPRRRRLRLRVGSSMGDRHRPGGGACVGGLAVEAVDHPVDGQRARRHAALRGHAAQLLDAQRGQAQLEHLGGAEPAGQLGRVLGVGRGEGGEVGVEVAVARERGVDLGVGFGARGRGARWRESGRRHGGQPTTAAVSQP